MSPLRSPPEPLALQHPDRLPVHSWSGQAGAANVLNVRAHMIVNDLEPSASKDGELRFGFRLVPTAKGKETVLQTSSYEERLLWTTTIDAVAHPDGTRHDAGIGRVVKVRRPERPAKLGIEIGSSSDFPCVVVLRLNGDLGTSGRPSPSIYCMDSHSHPRASRCCSAHLAPSLRLVAPSQGSTLVIASLP